MYVFLKLLCSYYYVWILYNSQGFLKSMNMILKIDMHFAITDKKILIRITNSWRNQLNKYVYKISLSTFCKPCHFRLLVFSLRKNGQDQRMLILGLQISDNFLWNSSLYILLKVLILTEFIFCIHFVCSHSTSYVLYAYDTTVN